jgi:hypothetical protein
MPRDPGGRGRGYGFVTLSTPAEADAAIGGLNGVPYSGRAIRVSRPANPAGGAAGAALIAPVMAAAGIAVGPPRAPVGGPAGAPAAPAPPPPAAPTPHSTLISYGAHVLEAAGGEAAGGAAAAAAAARLGAAKPAFRVHIGNVPQELAAAQVHEIFAPFGSIRSASLLPGQESGHRGYGFIGASGFGAWPSGARTAAGSPSPRPHKSAV